jgi:hypothetical protein
VTNSKERYKVAPPPKEKVNDPVAWQASIANAHAQLEHSTSRYFNDIGSPIRDEIIICVG